VITVPQMAAEALSSYPAEHMDRRFGATQAGLTELITSVARLALECIGNSDALYHNVEHTMLVTLAGYDIIKGRSVYADPAKLLRSSYRRLPPPRHRLCAWHPQRRWH
jgi:hypothetical protein